MTVRHPVPQVARWRPGVLLLFLIAGLIVLPLAGVVWEILTPTPDIWAHLWGTLLPRMIRNTATLLVGVGLGTLVLGTGLAWLVTAHRFPGRNLFDWALLLPLAIPGYIMGFVFIATFDFVGPVQSLLREYFGRGHWFPSVYTGTNAIIVLTAVTYPYVYLLARAAFREQSATIVEAGRVMGYSRLQTLFKLILPLARPSLVAGVSLAMMEALTDFATVRFFNYPTLSEGIFRIWEGMLNRQAAMELAALLLVFALLVIMFERGLRGQARYYQTSNRGQPMQPVTLRGWRAWIATGICALALLVAFILPTLQLGVWTWSELDGGMTRGNLHVVYGNYVWTTFSLAATAALVTVGLALLMAHRVRLNRGRMSQAVVRLATLGYAMPGAVVAVGVLLTLAPTDHALNDFTEQWLGFSVGLLLTGSMAGLVYAYVVRFMAVAYQSVEASFDKVTPHMEEAARTLGARPRRVLWRIHVPLVSVGTLAGATLVFVDVIKELPATMLLRPFGMDTLAIWAYMLAQESFWEAAAVPSLTILAVGVIPVAILVRLSDR